MCSYRRATNISHELGRMQSNWEWTVCLPHARVDAQSAETSLTNNRLGAQPVPISSALAPSRPSATRRGRPQGRAQPAQPVSGTNYAIPPQPLPATSAATPVIHPSAPLPAQNFTYNIYPGQAAQHTPSRPALQPPTSAPPQSWQAPNGIAPHQAHVPHTHTHQQILPSRPQNPYGRDEHWNDPAFPHITPGTETGPIPPINDTPAPGYYDHRFRDDQGNWPEPAHEYYDQQVGQFVNLRNWI